MLFCRAVIIPFQDICNRIDIPINFDIKFKGIESGAKVKIDDGKISFKVIKKISNSKILIRSKNAGGIKPKKGVNISGLNINLPTLQAQDIKFAKMAINLDLDWFRLPFYIKTLSSPLLKGEFHL